jgi:hypothetical protein
MDYCNKYFSNKCINVEIMIQRPCKAFRAMRILNHLFVSGVPSLTENRKSK